MASRVSRGGARQWDYLLTLIGILFAAWSVSLFVAAKKIKQK